MGLTRPRAEQIYNLDYKQATRVVTVTNITLAGSAPAQVDGVSLAVNDRVLVTGQTTASQNGIYDVTIVGTGSNGTWVRTSDANSTGEINAGVIVMVTEGITYYDTQWKLITDDPIVIGVTALTFTQNYSANSISGGTSNVTVYSNANVTISSAATPNVLVVTATGVSVTGNIDTTNNINGGNFSSTGTIFSSGNVTAGNVSTTGLISVVGNTYTGNILTNGYYYANGVVFGGGGTPGGVNTDIQFNDNGVFGGTVGFTFNKATNAVSSTGLFSATGNIYGGNVSTAGLVTATGNIYGGNISTAGNITGANINTPSGDLAENYVADAAYPAGTVIDFGGDYEITITTTSHSTAVAGIISTDPSYTMNSHQLGTHVLAVALTGRVPCRVIGTIRKGDRLVSSKIPGTAQAMNTQLYQPGCIIGKALGEYNSTEPGVIEVVVGRF
jgi:hypothetical protein